MLSATKQSIAVSLIRYIGAANSELPPKENCSRLPVRREQEAFSTALVVTELLSDGYLRYVVRSSSRTQFVQHNTTTMPTTLRRHHRQQQSNKKSALNKNIFYADYYRSLGLVSVVYKAKSVNRSVEPRWVAFCLVNATSQVVRRRSK